MIRPARDAGALFHGHEDGCVKCRVSRADPDEHEYEHRFAEHAPDGGPRTLDFPPRDT